MAHILDNPSHYKTQETPHDEDDDDVEIHLPPQDPVQHAAKVPVFDEDEEEKDYGTSSPTEDVFTMIFFAKSKSWAFFYGCFVFFIQMTILLLIYLDIVKDDNFEREDNNTFNVPALVGWEVTIAQGIALLIAVVSRDDVTTTLGLASFGYNSALQTQFPDASYSKFIFASVMRFTEGLIVIVVSFVFIVQANNVLDIFLNFAAVEFVASLDDLAYKLAKTGWVGGSLQRLVKDIEKVEHRKLHDEWRRFVKPVSMLLLLGAMYGGWGVVVKKQSNGDFLWQSSCKLFIVNFGDEVYPVSAEMGYPDKPALFFGMNTDELQWRLAKTFDKTSPPDLHYAFFSGEYVAKNNDGDRAEYYQNGFDDDVSSGMFSYCEKEESWVFTIKAFRGTGVLPFDTEYNCAFGWLMRSPRTKALRLEDVTTDGWRIWTGALDVASDFSISCTECKSQADCSFAKRGTCDVRTGQCTCEDGYRGVLCNYDVPCQSLTLFLDDGFGAEEGDKISGTINLIPGTVYRRPAYIFNYDGDPDDDDEDSEYEIVFYTGRRWYDAFFQEDELDLFESSNKDDDSLQEFDRFHAYWGNVLLNNLQWYSDVTNAFSPTGPLKWYRIVNSASTGGNYGPFGKSVDFRQRFECNVFNCASSTTVCGMGQCLDSGFDVSDFGGFCNCSAADFNGHFCEFSNEDSDSF